MLLGRNDDLIRALIITENDGFSISRWYAIPKYSGGISAAIAAGEGDDFSALSIHGNPDPNFVFERHRTATHPLPAQESFWNQPVVASLQGVVGHSPVLLTKHSLFVRETPIVRSIPRILNLF